MKKAILILVILIVAAGAVFYFGWINVEPGTFAVAHSTITGTVHYPLESGELHWLWQRLVPRSFHLYTIEKEPCRVNLDLSFPLPGSEELKEYGSFTLKVKMAVQYSVDFETAENLLDIGIIEEFEQSFSTGFQSQIEDTVTTFILGSMSKYSLTATQFDYSSLELLIETIKRDITQYAKPYKLKELQTTLTFSEIPQLETYIEALNNYFQLMAALSKLEQESVKREAEYQQKMDEDDVEIVRLRKYGELISQYPQLLKYFYVQKFSDKTRVLVLPQEETTGFPKMLETYEEYQEKELAPMEPEPLPEPDFQREDEEAEKETTIQEESLEKESLKKEKDRWYNHLKFWEYIKKQ